MRTGNRAWDQARGVFKIDEGAIPHAARHHGWLFDQRKPLLGPIEDRGAICDVSMRDALENLNGGLVHVSGRWKGRSGRLFLGPAVRWFEKILITPLVPGLEELRSVWIDVSAHVDLFG